MQNEIILSSVGWTLAAVGSLVVCIGGLVAYIFTQHAKDNRDLFAENREDHNRIHSRIDEVIKQ